MNYVKGAHLSNLLIFPLEPSDKLMRQNYYNPFAGTTLVYPTELQPDYQRYCQTGGRESIDQSPFERMVDMWLAGVAVAARGGLPPVDLSGKQTSNMITGAVFDGRDSWRVQYLMLLAIAIEHDVTVIERPNRIMAMANGLAAAGVPRLVAMLQDGDLHPIWNITEALESLLTE